METTQTADVTNEEKLIGLFTHFSIFLGGIVLPLIFWLIYRDKSKFIKFHSLQAIFFHIAYIVIIFLFVFIMIFGIVGIGMFSAGSHAVTGHSNPAPLIFGMIVFYGLLFVLTFGVIGIGVYMGVKAYQGEYVRYPIIGKQVYEHVFGKVN